MTFRVDHRVVCVADPHKHEPPPHPTRGQVLEIEAITPRGCLQFVGLWSHESRCFYAGFDPRCFRRVTDISSREALLTRAPAPEPVS